MISPRNMSTLALASICRFLLKPFNLNPESLAGHLDLPADLSVGQVEHRLLIDLEGVGEEIMWAKPLTLILILIPTDIR